MSTIAGDMAKSPEEWLQEVSPDKPRGIFKLFLGYAPGVTFEDRLRETVDWYVKHDDCWREINQKQAAYNEFMTRWYADRK